MSSGHSVCIDVVAYLNLNLNKEDGTTYFKNDYELVLVQRLVRLFFSINRG